MDENFSRDTLLQVAVQLFISVPKNSVDKINATSLEQKRAARIDEFVKFYSQLRDRLQEGAK